MLLKTEQARFCKKRQQKQNPAIGQALAGFKFYWGLVQLVVRGFAAFFNVACPYAKYARQEYVKPVPFIWITTSDMFIAIISGGTIFF